MPSLLRALPLALVSTFVTAAPAADSRPAATSAGSNSVRRQMTARILADAKPFEPPVSLPATSAEHPILTSNAVLMDRFIVKAAPVVRQVEGRQGLQLVPLAREMHGAPDAVGFTINLLRKTIGTKEMELNFNFLQGSGPGVDHGRDFNRVEIEFRFRF